MSEFAPPAGPPPPKVPEGWKAIWNDQYKEWFYVNIHTKQSQWDKPIEPAPNPNAPVSDAPPSYDHNTAPATAGHDTKKTFESNNLYSQNVAESDEALARRLQEEENARHQAHAPGGQNRGANDDYYGQGYGQQQQQQPQGYPPQQQSGYGPQSGGGYPAGPDYGQQQMDDQARGKSGGLFGKLKSKLAAGGAGGSRPMGAPMMGYNAGGYPPQQHGYGGYPPQGAYGQPGYGAPMYAQKPKRGMGVGGAAALGVGGGLLGGALLANALDDDDYQEGFQDGADYGGGDDMGDMGGDF